MKWLLEKWEGQSTKLKTLDVKIYRIDKDPKWKRGGALRGACHVQEPQPGLPGLRQDQAGAGCQGPDGPGDRSQDRETGDRRGTETIVCGQNDVWHYLHEGRQIFIFPLAKGERQRALDEGPLPFLFNMKAQEAEQRYDMTFVGENQKYYAVKVLPRLQEDKETFKSAFIYLDKKYLLPARIVLRDRRRPQHPGLHPGGDPRQRAEVKDIVLQGGRLQGLEGGRRIPPRGSRSRVQAAGRPGGAAAMPRR